MTQKAFDGISLYKGSPIKEIKKMLTYQDPSIVKELKNYFNARAMEDLVIKLHILT